MAQGMARHRGTDRVRQADPEGLLAHVGGFEALEEEFSYRIPRHEIRGRIPESVRGTFYRIGPGRNRIGGEEFGHWFDGDGMVHALTFTDEGAWYRNRYVRTPKYLRETREQRIVYRSFGHNAPGGWRANIGRPPANCANTNVLRIKDRLLALWEGGRPWELDPETLDTRGEHGFEGRLRPWEPFSAHPKVHPGTGRIYNHGVGMGITGPRLNLYELSPTGRMRRKTHIPLRRAGFFHDAGMSERHLILVEHPVVMERLAPFLLGFRSFDGSLVWRPECGIRAHVVSLETLQVVRSFELDDPFAVFHFGNCRDEGDEVVVDLVRYEDFGVNEALRNVFTSASPQAGQPWRLRLNLRTGGCRQQALPVEASVEFPQWDQRYSGGATRYLYSTAVLPGQTPGFFNGIQRLDQETGRVSVHELGPGRFTSEAVFVPGGPAEGDGWLCAVVYDADTHRSEVVLLDARSENLEEVAAVPLRNHVPFGFHCGYA